MSQLGILRQNIKIENIQMMLVEYEQVENRVNLISTVVGACFKPLIHKLINKLIDGSVTTSVGILTGISDYSILLGYKLMMGQLIWWSMSFLAFIGMIQSYWMTDDEEDD
ncbi:hypothetical protein JA1_000066 [Spathaspora sp. JA1]|nr:hypothetical protein JA1_000066 [Spathaspora sp. JA1]